MLNFVVGIEGWLSVLVNLEDKKWTEQNVNEHILGLVLMGKWILVHN